MDFHVEERHRGKTVKAFLFEMGVSRALTAKLKALDGGILLNGKRVTVRAVLSPCDVLSLAIEDTQNEKILPFNYPLDISFENEDFLVVNKPADMPTHPSHGHFSDTLANALVHHYKESNPQFRPRFINRLDRNTTGAVLVAKHPLSAATLSRMMQAGEIKKAYLAVVRGNITAEMTVKTGIRRTGESIILREVCDVGKGDLAITHVVPLLSSGDLSLLYLRPLTGRTHQLRVHMAHLGAPIVGDDLYGGADPRMGRHALHAAGLSLCHTGKQLSFFAALPPDMRRLLEHEFGKGALSLAEKAVKGA